MEGCSFEEHNQMEVVTKSLQSVPNSPKSPADSLHKPKGKIQKRDQQPNKWVFQKGGLPDGTELIYVHGTVSLLKGYKMGPGICCSCCNETISPSRFEVHAGLASRKKPYENIFLSNGMSLHEYASSRNSTRGHDELCGVCKEGGDLLLCAGCPSSFHKECVSETNTPQEQWFCKNCRNSMKCSGVDRKGQIAKRGNNRIAYRPHKSALVACAICRAYDFTKDGFDERTVLVCDQCEREYHICCLRSDKNMDVKELPAGNWFCTEECELLHHVLMKLVACGPEKIPDFLMGPIRMISRGGNTGGIGIGTGTGITDSVMKWIVVRGKDVTDDENHALLKHSVDILHACFDPIIDSTTGCDFIQSMAYGKIMGNFDFMGVHCAMLTIDSKVVTVGMFRVLGANVAELPLVATSEPYQGQGYFQLFFNCFEKLLAYLKIKKLVVPAAADVKSMWIEKFNFEKIIPRQLREYRQTFTSIVTFTGACLLEKEVPRAGVTFEDGVGFSLSMGV